MNESLVDLIRSVPETAVRLYLGGKATKENGNVLIEMDNRQYYISQTAFSYADKIATALKIRPREIEFASDVLELRHAAEDMFLKDLSPKGKNLPSILFVPAGVQMATAYIRAATPADILTENGLATAHHTLSLDLSKAIRYDILWLQLVAGPVITDIAQKAKEAGVKIVYDVDDRFDSIPGKDNPAAKIYKEQKVQDVWDIINLADLVTVTTKPLAKYIEEKTKTKTRVIPNHILATIWPRTRPTEKGIFRILWGGSATHQRDLGIVAGALERVLLRHKGKVRFTLLGEQLPKRLTGVEKYIDILGWVDFMEYPELLSSVGANMAIAPLKDDEFNHYKSDLKYLEYSACGYPSFLSPVGQYPELEASGAPTRLVDNKEWEEVFEAAIKDPDFLDCAGKAAKAWVEENRCLLHTSSKAWLEAAQTLL